MGLSFCMAVLGPILLFAGGHIVYRLLRSFEAVRRVRFTAHLFLLLLSVRVFCLLGALVPAFSRFGLLADQTLLNIVNGLLFFFFALVALRCLDTLVIEHMLQVGDEVPFSQFSRDLFILAVLIGTGLGILAYYNVRLTAFLTASAVLSAILGLALQDILGNIFAGIALSMHGPFRVGDWVGIGGKVFKVRQRDWRSAWFETLDGDQIVLPNSEVAKAEITNFSFPNRAHAQHVQVRVDLDAPPERVKAVLSETAAGVDGVLKSRAPEVWLVEYADFGAIYNIKYWLKDFERYPKLDNQVMSRAWYALRREGFDIPVPIRHVAMSKPTDEAEQAERDARRRRIRELLDSVEIFAPLSDADRDAIADRSRTALYAVGEALVKQGEAGDSFFLIESGRASVRVRMAEGHEDEVTQLGATQFFGEMSLLTGAERSATVVALSEARVAVIDKATFESVLHVNPDVAQSLSEVLAEIEVDNARRQATWAEQTEQAPAGPRSSGVLLDMIKHFFGLSE